MNKNTLKELATGLGFVILQLVLFRHLKVYEMQPDLALIYLFWYASKKNRTSAVIMAAALGFTQDALLDLWGLHMFSKTFVIFASYNFIPKNSEVRLLLWQIFFTIALASLFHNIIFLGLNITVENYSAELIFWKQLIGNSIYTAIVASFIHLFRTN